MDLSIIIVNWRSKDYLLPCIASIMAETRSIRYETIVIDSASYDGCGEMLRQQFPNVRFIQSKDNLGFAKANNFAFSESNGKHVLFLNPDTEIRDAAIDRLYSYLWKLPNAGAIGCRLTDPDGRTQGNSVHVFPSIVSQMFESEALLRCSARFTRSKASAFFADTDEPIEVDAVSGACMMMTRVAFEQVGGFSTDYFMYSEDDDLCYKLFNSGFRNFYIPSAAIVHHGGTSSSNSRVSSFSSIMIVESRWRFFRKTRSALYAAFYRASVTAISAARIMAASALWALAAVTGYRRDWTPTLKKWTARLRWSLRLEGWVRNFGP